jgi:hypothetical protein
MATLATAIGGLVPTTLISLLLIALFRRIWAYNLGSVLVANVLSLFISSALSIYFHGTADRAFDYVIPQAIVLVLTVFQWRKRSEVDPAG